GKIPPPIKIEKLFALIISEAPDVLNLTKDFLELGNFKTVMTTSPVEALKVLEKAYDEISMILYDILIPHRSVYPFLKEVRDNEKYKHINVVVFSRKGDDDEDGFFPYPYIFRPPTPPGDLGIVGELQAKEPIFKLVEYLPYCKYCGGPLAKGESICHVCGNKVE
ncbi:MAG: response regulator, partial [Promethearchaeota archaeon]